MSLKAALSKKDTKTAKDTAWKWFSLYIRLRDAMQNGYVKCCTCSVIKHFKIDMSAGHYYTKGAFKRIEFDERNVHSQCFYSCNKMKSGNLSIYTEYMKNRYGTEIFDQLHLANRLNPILGESDYREMAKKYRLLAKAEAKRVGVEI